jgi:hypothetical protein
MSKKLSDWFVRQRRYSDPDTGAESVIYEVMCPTPETWPGGAPWRGTGAWGDDYCVARYGAPCYHL